MTPHIAAPGQPNDTAHYTINLIHNYQTGQPLKYVVERNQAY